MLLEHEASLRALFTVAANPPGGGGVDVANKAAATLLSHVEWMQLVRALDFIDSEFTVRGGDLTLRRGTPPCTHSTARCTHCLLL